MFENLTGLGWGIVTFALVIGIGTIVLTNFGGSVGCPTVGYPNWNSSTNVCYALDGNVSNTTSPSGTAYTNVNYLVGQLGQSGLAGWTPAIIALTVGLLFLGAFMVKKGRNY